jgi:hypothetical protein
MVKKKISEMARERATARTGRRAIYASSVAHAAITYTVLSPTAYESRAARCSAGGRVRMKSLDRRIFRIN